MGRPGHTLWMLARSGLVLGLLVLAGPWQRAGAASGGPWLAAVPDAGSVPAPASPDAGSPPRPGGPDGGGALPDGGGAPPDGGAVDGGGEPGAPDAGPEPLPVPEAATAEPVAPFTFAAPEEVAQGEDVEWRVQSRTGVVLATGNSRNLTLAAELSASRRDADNRLGLEAGVTLVRSTALVVVDANGSGTIEEEEFQRQVQNTSEAWRAQARYDRFFAVSNSLFTLGRVEADVPAGISLIGSGQVGYSRELQRSSAYETAVEVGYDLRYQRYVGGTPGTAIHSARVALRHRRQLPAASTLTLGLEALANLDVEDAPNPSGGERVPILADRRVNGRAGLTTALGERLGVGFSFEVRYDRVPAPRPPLLVPYAPGFRPFAGRLDTSTEASLVFTFL